MEILDIIFSLITLIILEIILGIDNLVFLSILTEKLPIKERKKARELGLSMAWIMRLILLASAVWMIQLTHPIVRFEEFNISIRDIFLLVGGIFLIYKATQEIHGEVSIQNEQYEVPMLFSFKSIVIQVGLMDVIFSLDSVLTAVGITQRFWIMALAITIAILVMIYASHVVSQFIEKNPSIKILALCFLILIGTVLIADGCHFHVPRGYIYFAMAFSLGVETLNLMRGKKRRRRS